MNLFRSEEHVRRWSQFSSDTADSIISVSDAAIVQGTESRRHFLDRNYLSHWLPQRREERMAAQRRLAGNG